MLRVDSYGAYAYGHDVPDVRRSREEIAPDLRRTVNQLAQSTRGWPLVLFGETGSGKTCAGLAMCDHFGGWYTTLGDLHRTVLKAEAGTLIGSGIHSPTIYTRELWMRWHEANLTVIDEIGLRSPSDAQYETLHKALEARTNRPLVVISNLAMAEIGRVYDKRIVSRLAAGTQVTLTGDRRRS